MKLSLILLIPMIAYAGFVDIPKEEKYQYQSKANKEVPVLKSKVRKTPKKSHELEKLTEELIKADESIETLLKSQEKTLNVRVKENKVHALTRVKGIVLNSIVALNIKPTLFIVKLQTDDQILKDGELRCQGMSFQKRVPSVCDLLVVDEKEYLVDVKVWDLDGAEGILADYYYSGEEKNFLTSSFASFFSGVMDAAKDRIITPYGEASRNNAKNKVLGGLMGVSENAKQSLEDSAEKNLSIAFVNARKEVLVFFNQGLEMKEGQP